MTSVLHSLIGQDLIWVPTATFKSRYDLTAPDTSVLATLDMNNWSSKANATVPEGTLFIQKENLTGSKLAISMGEQGPSIADYQRKWTGTSGELLFPDERKFTWNNASFWGTKKTWTDSTNTVYVRFSSNGFSRKTTVLINPPAVAVTELSLLLVLGLYIILIERRAAAAAAR